jgi:16S rRNA (guanine(966)-N(2))-methyltransferase RsmD
MRITSGYLKNKKISLKKSSLIRPTTEKLRMAVFSILYNKVNGAIVLDLFCGSGALGIEAISRGAEFCSFIDINLYSFRLNMNLLDRTNYDYFEGDIFKVIHNLNRAYDIIFIDPPYGMYSCEKILNIIAINSLIKYNGIIIYEESVRNIITLDENRFFIVKEKIYGDTKIYAIGVNNGNNISGHI